MVISGILVEVIEVSALDEHGTNLFSLYPNPASSQVLINWSSANLSETVTLEIRDSRGRVVYHLENVSTSAPTLIDLKENQIESGIYLVHVMTSESTDIQKIIVE